MEGDELPDLEIGDYSAEYNLRTSERNVGQGSPTSIARGILQGDNIHDFGRAAEGEQLPDIIKGDALEDNEIRILVLYPSDDYNDPLRGHTERQILMPNGTMGSDGVVDEDQYEALSYTWETNIYGGFISIDNVDLPIPLNLKLALLRIRHEERARRIWADAVCINMANLIERGHQLSMIRRIFRYAKEVLVWTGEVSKSTPDVLLFLRRLAAGSVTNDPVSRKEYATEWQAVQILLMNLYFTRIWVVQEIAVARHITILHGNSSLDWMWFLTAIRISRREFAHNKAILSTYVDSHVDRAISFVLNIDKCSCLGEDGYTRVFTSTLEDLVFKFSTAKASDPRDKIYGLLGIAKDAHLWKSNEGFPDYSRSWEEVQKTFYMSCVKYSQSLDVIFHYAVPLIQAPGQASPYNLFDGYHLRLTRPTLTVLNSDHILTRGYLFDKVGSITDVDDTSDTLFPASWLSEDFITDAPKLAHTLLTEVEGVDFDPSLNLVRCISRLAEDSESREDYSTRLSKLLKAFEDLHALTKGRRLFRSRRWSIKGLGPAYMRADDLICFTPRCSVPIVLRKMENESWRYQVIGTCYVCDYMSGRISNLLAKKKLSTIEFAVPFGADESTSKVASTAAHIVNSDSTREVLDLARDSRTRISKASTNPSMVREVDVPQLVQGFRMYWICTCGFKGLGHYMESRPGAIRELATELQNGGYTVTLEAYNAFDIWNNFFDTAISRLQITAENFWKQYVTATLYTASRPVLAIKPADDLRNTRNSVPAGPKKTPALVPNTGSSGNARASASTSLALNQGTTTQSTSSPGTSVPIQVVPVTSSQVTAPTSTNSSTVTIPPSGDFIHVCFKVKRYLKLRHDLPLTQVIKDRELFANLREAYAANFSWAHRNLSIWTVQKINYVRFNQWERSEVTNLQRGVPPESERHYALRPNPRGYEPVLDNDHLMHRFTCSTNSRCLDGSIGFEHIPKRIDRPEPWNHDEHPDLGIGWGLQLEEGCFHRLCIIVVGGVVVSAVIGIIWSALTGDVQSGFVVASWLLTSGTILVATVQLLVTLPAV